MYRIKADDTLIFDSRLEDYAILEGVVDLEVNTAGSFDFTLDQTHPFYGRILKMKTIIKVYKKNNLIFRGRVVSDDVNFFKQKTFACEGELSFFNDSIQRPYAFTGSPKELLTQFINNHNAQVSADKQFKVGEVTVKDENDYINRSNSNYESTWKNINSRLLESLGGYFYITHDEDDMPILNWLEDFPYMSNQKIEFGENLMDFVKTDSTQEVATALIPLGAKIEDDVETQDESIGNGEIEKRLTIESVNGGLDYIYDEAAVERYGWIFATETWNDVTEPSNLLRKGKERLAEKINRSITIEVNAVDLSLMNIEINAFRYCTYIQIVSKPHSLDDKMLLTKQSINLLSPQADKITLGFTKSTFTDTSLSSNGSMSDITQRVEVIEGNYTTNTVIASEIQRLQSLINQTSESIILEVSSQYVTNDKLTSELGTLFTQLNDSFEFMFKSLQTTVDENNADAMTKFEEIKKYIRFEDGNIILGESSNELTLKIENDILAFYDNGAQIAYFQNRKLYVYDGEFLNSLKIGKFAFVPRANGNLSFKKVED